MQQRHGLGCRNGQQDGVVARRRQPRLAGLQSPATAFGDQCADGGLQADIEPVGEESSRRRHARRADETFETGIRLVFVLVAENHQSRLPRRGNASRLPASDLGAEGRIASGEVLRAVIALPALAAARAHAAARAAALVEQCDIDPGLLQLASAGQAGNPGADDRDRGCEFHCCPGQINPDFNIKYRPMPVMSLNIGRIPPHDALFQHRKIASPYLP